MSERCPHGIYPREACVTCRTGGLITAKTEPCAHGASGPCGICDRIRVEAAKMRRPMKDGQPCHELVLGCGRLRSPKLALGGIDHRTPPAYVRPWFVDNVRTHQPDQVLDIAQLPLPYDDESFEQIHAYDVLEHVGQQGDYRFFFTQFADFWRILKPGGLLLVSVPNLDDPFAWGDPSHTRVIPPATLVFLDQTEYIRQVGKTAMSDFRHVYQADFRVLYANPIGGGPFFFILEAVKPSRITQP